MPLSSRTARLTVAPLMATVTGLGTAATMLCL